MPTACTLASMAARIEPPPINESISGVNPDMDSFIIWGLKDINETALIMRLLSNLDPKNDEA